MTLASARFNSDETLTKIEATHSKPLQKGSKGRAVHLVQMALLDMGFFLPKSTGNPNYSPDGEYGHETEQAVRLYQTTRPGLTVDGKVGHATLVELDRRFTPFSHQVTLHFRSLALTSIPFQRSFANAQLVFGQYGIEVRLGSGESVDLSPEQKLLFNRIDPECSWNLSDGELNALLAIGSPVPANDVVVFHVNSFGDQQVPGCGGHAKTRVACTATASALAWDTAHEVGHALLTSVFTPVHVDDSRNLMFATPRTAPTVPALTNRQIAKMRASLCCRALK